jgi:DNA-binding beta-propeller fold protein YncE
MMQRALLLIALIVFGCQKENSESAPPMKEGNPPMPMTTAAPATGSQSNTLSGFATPESVLYDPDQDVYFVSNINGQPLAADDNGFISRINAETRQIDLKWIDAAKPDIILNAPKGMAILGDVLYVADLSVVRKFDRKTGQPKGEVAIPGSTFLNDLATDGKAVYVSDTGMKAGANGFEPSGTDAIWGILDDKPQKIASSPGALKHPNGLEVVDGKIWAVSFGGNELYRIENGKKVYVNTLPKGSLDGLVHLADGSFLVSSWEGKAVYRGKDNVFRAVIENIDSPADIGYDTRRHLLLVPHFMENVVSIHDVQ